MFWLSHTIITEVEQNKHSSIDLSDIDAEMSTVNTNTDTVIKTKASRNKIDICECTQEKIRWLLCSLSSPHDIQKHSYLSVTLEHTSRHIWHALEIRCGVHWLFRAVHSSIFIRLCPPSVKSHEEIKVHAVKKNLVSSKNESIMLQRERLLTFGNYLNDDRWQFSLEGQRSHKGQKKLQETQKLHLWHYRSQSACKV